MFSSLFKIVSPVLTEVVTKEQLQKVNKELANKGLPPFFLGFDLNLKTPILSPFYWVTPTPRFVWGRLRQLYLRPCASRGEHEYNIFVNHFEPNTPTSKLPDFYYGPELKFFL